MANIAKINLPDGNTYDIVDKKSGYYKKPDSGIPKSDLSADVQASLNKADLALPLSGGTVTGETTFNDNVHLENETYADSVTAGSLLVTGDARFVNGLYGNLKGNADSASSVAWDNVTGKPTSYTPSSHTHDDRYYTESEINTKISDINSSITSHTGNKSNPHGVTKSQVGLGNVDNTSDINKPVSTAQQSAIDTAYANSNAYTDQKIADLINGAPSTLDTLGEIATAMAEHEDVVSALNEAIGTKASQSELDTHTGNSTIHITASERTNWNSAKNHADSTHARTDATKVEKSSTNGNIKINGTETTVYTHPSGTNPHGTTKSDVGLGNVPNVATNDQTPSYTEATTLAKLTSGEKLSVAFGKISKAITDLISHIGNKSNPHGVTKSQVGLGNVENKSSATIRSELTKDNVTTALGYTPPTTDTNTWRGIQDNLTSTSTTDSLSANQGKILNETKVGFAKVNATEIAKTNNNPFFGNVENEDIGIGNGRYYSVINLGSYSGGNFRSQIAMPYQDSITDSDMYIRTDNSGYWRPWRKLIHSGNIGSQSVNYANSAGSASTATKATQDASGNIITSKYVAIDTPQTISGTKTFSNPVNITNTNSSINTTSGALKVDGGVGVQGQVSSNTISIGNGVRLEYSASTQTLDFIFEDTSTIQVLTTASDVELTNVSNDILMTT